MPSSKCLSQIFVIADEDFLNLAYIHGVEVAQRIALVDGLLIEEVFGFQLLRVHLAADEHQLGLGEVDGAVGIDF